MERNKTILLCFDTQSYTLSGTPHPIRKQSMNEMTGGETKTTFKYYDLFRRQAMCYSEKNYIEL